MEDAVGADRSGAECARANHVPILPPGGEGEFAGGAKVGREQPEAVGVSQHDIEGGADFAGETDHGFARKSVGAQECSDARSPCGEIGKQPGRSLTAGDAPGKEFQRGVDCGAERPGGE
jgi:hypothetical protein